MKRRGWWHIPLLLAVAALLLTALAVVEIHDRQVKRERAELMAQAAPLEQERDALIAQRDRAEREFREANAVPATEQLLFLELDPLIYTDLFPLLRERQIPGVLALYPGNLPDDPGCMSRAAFDELVAAGWELCLYCEGTEDFPRWDQEMTELLAQAGIPKPRSVYFPEDAFRRSQAGEILACGYTVAIHHGEGGAPLIADEAGEELWLTGAHPWNYTGVREEIQEVVRLGGQHCFTVRFSAGREEYLPNGFLNMLEFVEPYRQNGALLVTGLQAARDRHDPEKNGLAAARAEWERQDEIYAAEIRRLNGELEEIYAQWNGEEYD